MRPGGGWGGGEERDDFGKQAAADVKGEGEQQATGAAAEGDAAEILTGLCTLGN